MVGMLTTWRLLPGQSRQQEDDDDGGGTDGWMLYGRTVLVMMMAITVMARDDSCGEELSRQLVYRLV